MISTRSPRISICWPPVPSSASVPTSFGEPLADIERVELAVGDREHAPAVGLDDVGLVDAGLLHVRRRERRRRRRLRALRRRRAAGAGGAAPVRVLRDGRAGSAEDLRHDDAGARRHAGPAARATGVALRVAEQRLARAERGQRGRPARALGSRGRDRGQPRALRSAPSPALRGAAVGCGSRSCAPSRSSCPPCRSHADTTSRARDPSRGLRRLTRRRATRCDAAPRRRSREPVALHAIAVRAQQLQVLRRARAAEAERDDVVVLQVEARPALGAAARRRARRPRGAPRSGSARAAAARRARRRARASRARARAGAARAARARARAPARRAPRAPRPRSRSGPRTATCSAARRARAPRAPRAALPRSRAACASTTSGRSPAPPASRRQRRPSRREPVAHERAVLDLAQHRRLSTGARGRRATRIAKYDAGAMTPARAASRAIRRASANALAREPSSTIAILRGPRSITAMRQCPAAIV